MAQTRKDITQLISAAYCAYAQSCYHALERRCNRVDSNMHEDFRCIACVHCRRFSVNVLVQLITCAHIRDLRLQAAKSFCQARDRSCRTLVHPISTLQTSSSACSALRSAVLHSVVRYFELLLQCTQLPQRDSGSYPVIAVYAAVAMEFGYALRVVGNAVDLDHSLPTGRGRMLRTEDVCIGALILLRNSLTTKKHSLL
jgi:hypothetical protein